MLDMMHNVRPAIPALSLAYLTFMVVHPKNLRPQLLPILPVIEGIYVVSRNLLL
jgi:hypothetical protein